MLTSYLLHELQMYALHVSGHACQLPKHATVSYVHACGMLCQVQIDLLQDGRADISTGLEHCRAMQHVVTLIPCSVCTV